MKLQPSLARFLNDLDKKDGETQPELRPESRPEYKLSVKMGGPCGVLVSMEKEERPCPHSATITHTNGDRECLNCHEQLGKREE